MPVTVRVMKPEDRAGWEVLYRGYADFYQVPMTPEILDTVWSWIFDQGNPFYGQVAVDEHGELVGVMHFRSMPSPLRGTVIGFLDDLFVTPECRGSGVVDALFTALNQAAKTQGWPFVRWITSEDNYRGRGVYDKLADKTRWVTYQMPVA